MSNQVATIDETNIVEPASERASSLSVIFDKDSMQAAMNIAELMATSKVTVPKHLQGQAGDCMAIVMQAMNWGMNPFTVAQKTHLVNGALGYEAQLVNAVIQSQGFIVGRPTYEYNGSGNSLECRVGAVIKGETEITYGEWLSIKEVTVKNSPLWKTNPKQQMGYLQIKNWARAYCPGAILGVYTRDELEATPARDVTPRDITPQPEYYTDEQFKEKSEKWQATFLNGHKTGKTVADFVAWAEQMGTLLTDDQKTTINGWMPIEGDAEPEPDAAPEPEPEAEDTTAGDEYFAEADAKRAAQQENAQ